MLQKYYRDKPNLELFSNDADGDILKIHIQWFAQDDEGKTEDPTEYRLKKEREEGRIPKSPDLVSAIGLLLTSITLAIIGPWIFSSLRNMARWFITVSVQLDPATDGRVIGRAFLSYFSSLALPIAVVAVISAIFSNLLQTGFLFTAKPIKPDIKRIIPNFGQYIKRSIMSIEAIFNLAKSLLKIVIIGFVAYSNIKSELPILTHLYTSTIWNSTVYIATVVIRIIIEAAILLIVLAVPDYIFQKRQFKKRLKMTKHEVKEERKMFEGDPLIKDRLKRRMRDIMSQNMAANVPKADVIITNPTHYAIAIEYDPHVMAVPTVIAKGSDELAFRIRSIAQENNVPIIENKPLARALYADVEIGESIPAAYYEAISTILVHIASLDKRLAEKYATLCE